MDEEPTPIFVQEDRPAIVERISESPLEERARKEGESITISGDVLRLYLKSETDPFQRPIEESPFAERIEELFSIMSQEGIRGSSSTDSIEEREIEGLAGIFGSYPGPIELLKKGHAYGIFVELDEDNLAIAFRSGTVSFTDKNQLTRKNDYESAFSKIFQQKTPIDEIEVIEAIQEKVIPRKNLSDYVETIRCFKNIHILGEWSSAGLAIMLASVFNEVLDGNSINLYTRDLRDFRGIESLDGIVGINGWFYSGRLRSRTDFREIPLNSLIRNSVLTLSKEAFFSAIAIPVEKEPEEEVISGVPLPPLLPPPPVPCLSREEVDFPLKGISSSVLSSIREGRFILKSVPEGEASALEETPLAEMQRGGFRKSLRGTMIESEYKGVQAFLDASTEELGAEDFDYGLLEEDLNTILLEENRLNRGHLANLLKACIDNKRKIRVLLERLGMERLEEMFAYAQRSGEALMAFKLQLYLRKYSKKVEIPVPEEY